MCLCLCKDEHLDFIRTSCAVGFRLVVCNQEWKIKLWGKVKGKRSCVRPCPRRIAHTCEVPTVTKSHLSCLWQCTLLTCLQSTSALSSFPVHFNYFGKNNRAFPEKNYSTIMNNEGQNVAKLKDVESVSPLSSLVKTYSLNNSFPQTWAQGGYQSTCFSSGLTLTKTALPAWHYLWPHVLPSVIIDYCHWKTRPVNMLWLKAKFCNASTSNKHKM